jgi:D-3-phosphoglycerate dehydrogenase
MNIVLIEPLGIPDIEVEKLSQALKNEGHIFTTYKDRKEDSATLIERAKDADVVILTNLPFKGEVIKECSKLKMISVAFTGVDHVDMAECKARGIMVCNCAGYSTSAVAELAYGLIISLYRNLIKCDVATRAQKTKAGLIGNELSGKTLGVVGTGAIGEKVAKIGAAFDCNVIAYSRTKKPEVEALGVKYAELDKLLASSDIVTLHVPLNSETKNLINKEKLSMMKPSALLINTARGPVVDNQALTDALKEGKIAGAGIDVFDMEPPIPADYTLNSAPNTVFAPHVAFATEESLLKRAVIVFKNVEFWLAGTPQNII